MFTILFKFLLSTASFGSSYFATEHVEARLYSGYDEVAPSLSSEKETQIPFLLELKVQKDWHTYWKNPGDSGAPIKIKEKSFETSDFFWPTPKRFPLPPLMNLGYEGKVLLPFHLVIPSTTSSSPSLQFDVSWLVCKEVCIPEKGTLTTTLQISTQTKKSKFYDLIQNEIQKNSKTLSSEHTSAEIDGKTVEIKGILPEALSTSHPKFDFFPYQKGVLDLNFIPQVTSWDASSLEFSLKVKISDLQEPKDLSSLEGIVVVDDQHFEFNSKTTEAASKLFSFLLFAFLGGLILNLMPCVFPVLSIKIFQFIEKSKKTKEKASLHSLSFSVGIILSFLLLALVLHLLRNAGEQIGWGFQLQIPEFIVFLILIFYLMALNFLGFFEFSSSLSNVGDSHTKKEGYAGSFFTGFLATLAATPCTAPFMGSAMGYAFTQNAAALFTIFLFLALGMSSPYLLLTWKPELLRFLPKPGMWMVKLKEFFAFPLFLTCLWLFWILSFQTSSLYLLKVIFFLLTIAFLIWLKKSWSPKEKTMQESVRTILLTLLVFLTLLFSAKELRWNQAEKDNHAQTMLPSSDWQEYSEEALQVALEKGQPVFIDFTAAWCVTCQLNKKTVLERQETLDAFQKKNVKLFLADWTEEDPVITKALERYGRSGVPVYVLYPGGNNPYPEVLPELLTPSILKEALDQIQ